MPSEVHPHDGGTISAVPSANNPALAQLSHQEPPPVEEAAAAASHEAPSGGSEQGKGDKVDAKA